MKRNHNVVVILYGSKILPKPWLRVADYKSYLRQYACLSEVTADAKFSATNTNVPMSISRLATTYRPKSFVLLISSALIMHGNFLSAWIRNLGTRVFTELCFLASFWHSVRDTCTLVKNWSGHFFCIAKSKSMTAFRYIPICEKQSARLPCAKPSYIVPGSAKHNAQVYKFNASFQLWLRNSMCPYSISWSATRLLFTGRRFGDLNAINCSFHDFTSLAKSNSMFVNGFSYIDVSQSVSLFQSISFRFLQRKHN